MAKPLLWLFLMLIFLCGCSNQKPFYNREETGWRAKNIPDVPLKYSVYLLGGAGEAEDSLNDVTRMLRIHLEQSDTNHAIIFLSDHFYENGLPEENDPERKTVEKKLDAQLSYLKNDKGKIFFISGDHDVIKGKRKRQESAARTQNYVENVLGRKNIFLPEDHCPGPDKILLTDDIIMCSLNTTWWLNDKDERNNNCDIKEELEWIDEVKDMADNNQRRNILVLGHHPLLNVGNHGGYFSLKQHLFPLTDVQSNLFIPLPVIGSLYPLYRAGIGFKHDIAYPRYLGMKKNLMRAFEGYQNVVYVSSHEHNFQHFNYMEQDYIITNSSSNISWVSRKKKASFTYAEKGFVKLSYLQNGEVWMEIFVPEKNKKEGNLVYRNRLNHKVYEKPNDSIEIKPAVTYTDSSVTVAANKDFKTGAMRHFFWGKHYRKAWKTPLTFPVFDFYNEEGGMEIIKKGGGIQTKSLQLRNPKGEEFVIRSVMKYHDKRLRKMMQNTFASDIVRDQITTKHPYGTQVVEHLSETAGILHTISKNVYLPNDKILAEYRKEFANMLVLYEQRPAGDLSGIEHFGNTKDAVSSDKMFKILKENNGITVDKYFLIKNRLFDMWINDWDRHGKQWRWGIVECTSANEEHCKLLNAKDAYFIPIPKDRDQVFTKFDGVFPWFMGRKWTYRKYQNFGYDIRDIEGFNYGCRFIDHALLTGLSFEDWIRAAEELKQVLTDDKIEAAVRQWPDTLIKLDGEEIIEKLKSRRNKFVSFAENYYRFLALEVDLIGSDEKELFEVRRINNDSTSVKMYDNDEGFKSRLIFERIFKTDETKEIRLYGRGGNDVFDISGETGKGILIRIIGGDGKDSITDLSQVSGWSRKTKLYDDKNKNELKLGKETKDLTSDSKGINAYNFYEKEYNLLAPATFFGYNTDDGIFLGGGVIIKRHGFRRKPYASYQKIVANTAVETGSFNFKYKGDFIKIMGNWGLNIDFLILAPKSITNFFGIGNDTEKRAEAERNYYRVRYDQVHFFPSLKRRIGKYNSIRIGPIYDYIKIEKTPDRFITSTEGQPYMQDFTTRNFAGGKFEYELQYIDDTVMTRRGVRWTISATTQAEIKNQSLHPTNLQSALSLYIPLPNRSTFALRGGVSSLIGDFEFYQANTLGGHSVAREGGNLRGYIRGRYSGRSVVYLNADLRVTLFGFHTYLLPAQFGVLGFYDLGRVWNSNETSNTWHNGYGGGIWLSPFGMTIVNMTYAVSKEERLYSLSIGFLF